MWHSANCIHNRVTIVVWVTYYLALRPESQEAIRKESQFVVESSASDSGTSFPSQKTMKQAVFVDSFVREVLRMKGDSVNLVRESIRDVELGGYIIPKGR